MAQKDLKFMIGRCLFVVLCILNDVYFALGNRRYLEQDLNLVITDQVTIAQLIKLRNLLWPTEFKTRVHHKKLFLD